MTDSKAAEGFLDSASTSSESLSTLAKTSVLENQDLLNLIFQDLGDYPEQASTPSDLDCIKKRRQHLLWAALTCKSFLSPALDSLWESIDSLFPLLKLLPSFSQINGFYVLQGLLTADDWEKWDSFARRIRTVTFGLPHPVISKHVYLRLGFIAQARSSALLPALRCIRIHDGSMDFSGAFLALSPNIQEVEVLNDGIADAEFLESFLASIASDVSSPTSLTKLSLCGDRSVSSLDTIARFGALQCLEIKLPSSFISMDTLKQLGTLQSLANLVIDAGSLPSTQPVTQSPIARTKNRKFISTESRFPSLTRLEVIGCPSRLSRILAKATSQVLNSLTLRVQPEQNPQGHWMDCFQQVSQVSQLLRSVHIFDAEGTYSQFNLSFISALIDLPNIENFVLDVYSFSGGNEVIETIASSWPRLRRLTLPPTWEGSPPTLLCLVSIAHCCPLVETVRICIDSTDVSFSSPQQTLDGSPLKSLFLSDMRNPYLPFTMDQFIRVARYLDVLFPSLSILDMHRNSKGQGSGTADQWNQIQQLQKAFQEVREITASAPSTTVTP